MDYELQKKCGQSIRMQRPFLAEELMFMTLKEIKNQKSNSIIYKVVGNGAIEGFIISLSY